MNRDLKYAINIYCDALINKGVAEKDVKEALHNIVPELKVISDKLEENYSPSHNEPVRDSSSILNNRSDFLGRAMLMSLERYLPEDAEDHNRITQTPIDGKLPREAFEGVITAIKSSHGYGIVEEYEKKCSEKIKGYVDEKKGEVDMEAFYKDPEVLTMVNEMMRQAREVLSKLEDDMLKEWLGKVLSNSSSFKNMNRDLTEEEYRILKLSILRTGG